MLSKGGGGYRLQALPNFHILKDWGRKGLANDGTERICCFPEAHPQQDRLLTGDNRWVQEMVQVGGVRRAASRSGRWGAVHYWRACAAAGYWSVVGEWDAVGERSPGCAAQLCCRHSYPQPHSLLWMLIEGEPWSLADHCYWPPAFKAVTRTLLLAHRRGAPVRRRSGASKASGSAAELQARLGVWAGKGACRPRWPRSHVGG